MHPNQPAKPFTLQLNGRAYSGTYAVKDNVVVVDSTFGTASASAVEESNYATAITLFFGILAAARAAGKLPED
jgi:hypothetical protein